MDLCLPAIFALFLWEAIQRGRFRGFRWIPLVAAASDYAENLAITALLLRYPDRLPAVVLLSSAVTLAKHAGYLLSVLLAAAGYLGKDPNRGRLRTNANNC